MNHEHQQVKDDYIERIRQRFANGIGKGALWLAEKVGEHYEPPFEYLEEEEGLCTG